MEVKRSFNFFHLSFSVSFNQVQLGPNSLPAMTPTFRPHLLVPKIGSVCS